MNDDQADETVICEGDGLRLGFSLKRENVARAHEVARYAREHPYGASDVPSDAEVERHTFLYGPLRVVLLHVFTDAGLVRSMLIRCKRCPVDWGSPDDELHLTHEFMRALVALACALFAFSKDAEISVDEEDAHLLHVTEPDRPSGLN